MRTAKLLTAAVLWSGVSLVHASGNDVWEQMNFEGRALVAISDADMQATAYATGQLNPLADQEDALSLISFPKAGSAPVIASIKASNSVVSWPQVVALSPDQALAYVIETRAAPKQSLKAVSSVFTGLPTGTTLSVFDISRVDKPRHIKRIAVADNPGSITISPDGKWLVINAGPAGNELYLVPTRSGKLGKPIQITNLPSSMQEQGIGSVQWHPTQPVLAINSGNKQLGFYKLKITRGKKAELQSLGKALEVGTFITSGEFTPDGKFFVITDGKWGTSQSSFLLNPRGDLISIKFDINGQHSVVSKAEVGLSPEGFAMNPAGTLLVAANMNRTYLPEAGIPGGPWPGVDHSSLSLVTLNPESGELKTLDHYDFEGLLPESATFDASGNYLAVAIFHMREDKQQRGVVEFWKVEQGSRPKLKATGAKVYLARGVHDLELAK
ncbi:MAG: hypothetical protein COA42_16930 [Alteromonadaceae bacterium]|nr:MAG: hypothetical protein COA42_16930 [Alteromonadaceae bacterium]